MQEMTPKGDKRECARPATRKCGMLQSWIVGSKWMQVNCFSSGFLAVLFPCDVCCPKISSSLASQVEVSNACCQLLLQSHCRVPITSQPQHNKNAKCCRSIYPVFLSPKLSLYSTVSTIPQTKSVTMVTRRIVLAFLVAGVGTTSAFVPSARTSKVTTTNLHVIPGPAELGDLSSLSHAAQEILTSTSALVSDAAAATADAAKEDGGWWRSYLQIFRNILVWEHSLIDGPLKSMGVESTWGYAIALFTCSK